MKTYAFIPVLTVAASLAMPGEGLAQQRTISLTYTETSQMDARGLFAPMMRMMPGTGTEPSTRQIAMHVQGGAMIQGGVGTASVIDLDAGHMLMIDHGARTVMRITMQEAAEFTAGTMAQITDPLTGLAGAADMQGMEGMDMGMTFSVQTGSAGRQQDFGPQRATHHWIAVRADMTNPGAGGLDGGAIFMINEIWVTHDVPTEAELFEEWALRIPGHPALEEFREMANQDEMPMNALLDGWMPGLSGAMEEMLNAVEQIGGTIVEETMIIAMGPSDVVVNAENLDQLAAWENPDELENAMPTRGDIVRGAVSGALGGLIGGRRAPPAEPTPPPAMNEGALAPVLRLVTTRSNIVHQETDEDLLGALMTQIADYQVKSLADVMRTLPSP